MSRRLILLDLILAVLVAVLWLPLVSEILCVLARRTPTPQRPTPGPPPRLLFLVPAHDEELLISSCVESLTTMEYPHDQRRIIVVADNCSDHTPQLARKAGAECLERVDPSLPGKPRAIVWALGQIQLKEWDAVVIVDADSVVDRDFCAGLIRHAPLRDIVVQANFLVLNERETWLTRLGGVLSRCRYEISYPLKEAAGINCPMTGNGMCIGAGVLEREGWNAFSITEDSELYASYTAAGVRIHHASEANLRSQEAGSMQQGATQRRRWLAGRIWVIRTYWRQLLTSRRISWRQKLDTFVELGLSSPVLHLLVALIVAGLAWAFQSPPLKFWTMGLALASTAGLALSTLLVLLRHPEPLPTALAFLRLPFYAVWRLLTLAGTLLTLSDKRWKRTSRTGRSL